MAINLVKGQTIDLRKNEKGENYDLSKVTVGLGWDVRKPEKSGLFDKFFKSGSDPDFDLDAIAFLLDDRDKVANKGIDIHVQGNRKISFQKGDVIFFNNLTYPSGNFGVYNNLSKPQIASKVGQLISSGEVIIHTGDNLTGEGDGDDEQIIVMLNSLPDRIKKIVFLVCIYQGINKNQNFALVENAFIRAVDKNGKEIARYSLSGDSSFKNKCSLIFGELYRKDGEWKFRALGEPLETDSFVDILKKYI